MKNEEFIEVKEYLDSLMMKIKIILGSTENPDSIFYYYEGEIYFEFLTEDGLLLVKQELWESLARKYQLNFVEIKRIIHYFWSKKYQIKNMDCTIVPYYKEYLWRKLESSKL